MAGYEYYQSKVFIDKDQILRKVSQEEIFSMVLGYLPEPYSYVTSIFREDTLPQCYFEWYNNILWFIDWAEQGKRRHRDCFNVIQDYFKVSFYKALELVNEHFKLGLMTIGYVEEKIEKKPIKSIQQPDKKVHDILFKARGFNSTSDRKFWKPYGITKAQLIEDNVFPIIWYKVFSKRLKSYVCIRPSTVSYLIFKRSNRIKIYTPHITGKGKWVTNSSEKDVGGYDKLIFGGDKLYITKSYKDYRVLKNQGLKVIWFQNEGMIPGKEVLEDLCSRFMEIIIFFDNDSTGIEAATKLKNLINSMSPNKASNIHLPISLLSRKIKDPSDLIKRESKEALLWFLKEG